MTLPAPFTNVFVHKQKSYKMVLILVVLEMMEELKKQEVPVTLVRARFLQQLQAREKQGLPVDAPPESVGRHWGQVQGFQINGLIQTPIKALKDVLLLDSSKQMLRFSDELRAGWSETTAQELREHATRELEAYYNNQQPAIPVSLREHLLQVMSQYVDAKRQPFTGHALGTLVRNTIPQELYRLPFIDRQMRIQGSVGQESPSWTGALPRRPSKGSISSICSRMT